MPNWIELDEDFEEAFDTFRKNEPTEYHRIIKKETFRSKQILHTIFLQRRTALGASHSEVAGYLDKSKNDIIENIALFGANISVVLKILKERKGTPQTKEAQTHLRDAFLIFSIERDMKNLQQRGGADVPGLDIGNSWFVAVRQESRDMLCVRFTGELLMAWDSLRNIPAEKGSGGKKGIFSSAYEFMTASTKEHFSLKKISQQAIVKYLHENMDDSLFYDLEDNLAKVSGKLFEPIAGPSGNLVELVDTSIPRAAGDQNNLPDENKGKVLANFKQACVGLGSPFSKMGTAGFIEDDHDDIQKRELTVQALGAFVSNANGSLRKNYFLIVEADGPNPEKLKGKVLQIVQADLACETFTKLKLLYNKESREWSGNIPTAELQKTLKTAASDVLNMYGAPVPEFSHINEDHSEASRQDLIVAPLAAAKGRRHFLILREAAAGKARSYFHAKNYIIGISDRKITEYSDPNFSATGYLEYKLSFNPITNWVMTPHLTARSLSPDIQQRIKEELNKHVAYQKKNSQNELPKGWGEGDQREIKIIASLDQFKYEEIITHRADIDQTTNSLYLVVTGTKSPQDGEDLLKVGDGYVYQVPQTKWTQDTKLMGTGNGDQISYRKHSQTFFVSDVKRLEQRVSSHSHNR